MKTFQIPFAYRSSLITSIKENRRQLDHLKKDFNPTRLDLGILQVLLARHFGFCYGVENAIEISFRAVEENPGKAIFLLSEMIHNPVVNQDLASRGVRFILDTKGKQIIPWEALKPGDIVIIPAFGTTLETEKKLRGLGIEPLRYNTTCPFVERVWNKAASIMKKKYTVIVHGKPGHEETRATFSHSTHFGPTVIIKDLAQARKLCSFITGELPAALFFEEFRDQYSEGFDPRKHLQRVGVVNQTTMLADETQEISDLIRNTIIEHYRLTKEEASARFADTRDTLCYATNDNQSAVSSMLEQKADLAIVVGGYNSSNTSHLVEMFEKKLPTYFISGAANLVSETEILHWDFHRHHEVRTAGYLPARQHLTVMITSGASCPDAVVEEVLQRLASFYGAQEILESLEGSFAVSAS